ncbi:MAG: transcriptional regulator TrmB [Candidatus Taylorbacteria bacterium]|nr:transcriptional regulator TrmB [Candidatus Taylorbacteria bacterium]
MSANETLHKIGLNDKEIKVYTALLRNGRVTPTALSKLTKINRPTVYNVVSSLLSKGIIAEDLSGKTLYLTPLPPEHLNQIIEKPRRELKEKESLVKKAIAELSLIGAENKYPVPKIRFVEEQDLEDYLYDNFIKWNNELLKTDGIWWGFQDHSLVEHYKEWILWTWQTKEYQNPKIQAHLLSNNSPIEQKLERKMPRHKRGIRFVSGMDFTSTTWVTGDYLVMVFTRQHPFYLVEIHDAAMAQNMREVFKKLWGLTS